MSIYIDAEALLKDLKEELDIDSPILNEVENKWVNKGIRIAIKDVKHFPTADAVEVRHGEWQIVDSDLGYVEMRCSLCGCKHLFYTKQGYPYCPNCGAKMESERREE